MRNTSRTLLASLAAAGLFFCGGLSAQAATGASDPANGQSSAPVASVVKMGVKIDGQLAPIDAAQVEAATEGLPEEPASQEGIRPYLINWDQWYGCFSLNHEDDVFAEYNHFWDGVGYDVRLKCGSGNEYQGWGYKHIRAKHEADWQAKLNSARDAGWISEAQGVESWDDLMAAATGVAVTWPEFKGGNSISQTSCGVAEMYFWNTETGQTVYSFQLRAVWADNNDRLITSYPQHGTTC